GSALCHCYPSMESFIMSTPNPAESSNVTSTRPLMITQKDLDKLTTLMEDYRGDAASRPYFKALKKELANALVVTSEEIPADVVTMNSTVKVRSGDAKRAQTFTIVYPEYADIDEDKISILAPI